MKSIKILFIIIAYGLVGCSEDDNSINRTYSSLAKEFEYPKLFTKNGQITDATIVENVIKRHNERGKFENFEPLATTKNPDSYGWNGLQVTLSEGNNIIISSESGQEELSFIQEENFIRVVSPDTVSFLTSDTLLLKHLGLHNPLYIESNAYILNGASITEWKWSKETYFRISKEHLRLPLLDYFTFGGSTFSGMWNGWNNELNPKVYLGLAEGDTLIVQQTWLTLE